MIVLPRASALAALALAALAHAAAPDDWHALNHQAALQAKAEDYAGLHDTLVRLAPLMPGSPTIAYNLAASAARLGHADEALRALSRLADAGLFYDLAADDDFAVLADRADFRRCASACCEQGRRGRLAARLGRCAATDWLPESLAWDAATKRLFVERRAPLRDPRRRRSRRPRAAPTSARVRAPAGVGLRARRRRDAPPPVGDHRDGRAGRRLRRRRGRRTNARRCSRSTCAPAACCSAWRPACRACWATCWWPTTARSSSRRACTAPCCACAPAPRPSIASTSPASSSSPQMPALSADGRTLFVPDYARGIAAIELGACPCPARWPANGPGVFTAGIDGLVRDGRTLVAVQNGTSPPRVVRFAATCAPAGARVRHARPRRADARHRRRAIAVVHLGRRLGSLRRRRPRKAGAAPSRAAARHRAGSARHRRRAQTGDAASAITGFVDRREQRDVRGGGRPDEQRRQAEQRPHPADAPHDLEAGEADRHRRRDQQRPFDERPQARAAS